jgi:hypothetical protein
MIREVGRRILNRNGTHATDVGFLRMADAIEPVLRRILK